jgi:hypothetical protein
MPTRYLILFAVVALVGGCANMGKLQAGCETTTDNFPAMAACLKSAVATSEFPGMKDRPDVKLYLLKADQLALRVANGQISDLDARVELQTLFVQLKQQAEAGGAAAGAAAAANRPRTTRCYPVGNQVQCNTY